MQVKLLDKSIRPRWVGGLALTQGVVYEVIGIEADDFRILDDKRDPVLFAPGLFEFVDCSYPESWVVEIGEGGEVYAYPKELGQIGFFEDYHDDNQTAINTFWEFIHSQQTDKPCS